jgi:uncharacterized protein (DUF488 family)
MIPIAICAKPPAGYKGPSYKVLAPDYGTFSLWKQNKDQALFTENYTARTLCRLDAATVVAALYDVIGATINSCDIALVCFEKPTDFCHRHLVAEWLRANGYTCTEFVNQLS